MKDVSEEDYILMSAWCQVLVDGICYIIEGFSGQAGKAMKDASQHLPPDIRKKIPSLGTAEERFIANREAVGKNLSSPPKQNIPKQQMPESDSGPGRIFKNPQVAKGVRSVYADYRLRQYEKNGLIEECIKQREERTGGK
jgi:hypothetical protein